MTEVQESGTRRKVKLTYIITAVAISCLMVGASFAMILQGTSTPSIPTVIEPGSMVSTADYIIFTDGTNYFAKNGTTGAITFSNSNATSLFRSVFALSNPGSVYVASGLYVLTLSTTGYAIDIKGNHIGLYLSDGATLKLADHSLTGEQVGGLIRVGDGSAAYGNITIQGGLLDGNNATNYAPGLDVPASDILLKGNGKNILINHVHFQDSPGDAIAIWATSSLHTKNVTVQNCRFDRSAEGILFVYTDEVKILDNSFYVLKKQDGIEPSYSTNFTIEGNYIYQSIQSAIDVFVGASHGIIANNIAVKCGQASEAAIQMGSYVAGTVNNISVIGNIIQDAGIGIRSIDHADHLFIENNQILNTLNLGFTASGTGIYVLKGTDSGVHHVVIRDNSILKAQGVGILFDSYNGSIIGNSIKQTLRGIEITSNALAVQVSQNDIEYTTYEGIKAGNLQGTINNNFISHCGSAANRDGLYVPGGKVNLIANTVEFSYGAGIHHTGNNCSIRGNTLRDNDQSLTATIGGIWLTGANMTVSDNLCYDDQGSKTQQSGIYVQGSKFSLIENNRVYGNANRQIYDGKGTGTLVRWNLGYCTERSGSAPVTGSGVLLHIYTGFDANVGAASLILILCNNTGAGVYVVSNIYSNDFYITFQNQPGANTWTFYWYAQKW